MIKFIDFLMYAVQHAYDWLLDVYDILKSARMAALTAKLTELEKAIRVIETKEGELILQKTRLEWACESIRDELKEN